MSAKRFYYLLLLAFSASLLSIFGAFYLGNQQLESKSDEIGDLIAQVDVSQEKIFRLQRANEDAQTLTDVQTLVNRLLPEAKEQDRLIADLIFTATSEAGISIDQVASFSFSGGSEPDTLSGTERYRSVPGVFEYPFSMQLNGITYTVLLSLLNEIEQNGRIVQISNLQITPSREEQNVLTVTLAARAFIKP